MNHKKVYQKRLQSLDKGKAKSLGPVEKLTMRYAGWVDGKHGLLRCSQNGDWQSSVLKQEVDSYEEFCAGQMGRLKFEEEDEFADDDARLAALMGRTPSWREATSDAES